MSSGCKAPQAPSRYKLALRGTLLSLLVLGACNTQPQTTALQEVKARGELTLVGVSGPTTFYQQNGQGRGFQYELARLFAEDLGVKLVVEEAANTEGVIKSIRGDQADMAITGLVSDDPRLKRLRVGQPYQAVDQQLIYRTNKPQPLSFDDVEGATIAVAAGSSAALQLREKVRYRSDLQLLEVPSRAPEDLLELTLDDKVDYVVMNSDEFAARRALFPELAVALNLQENAELAWAFGKAGNDRTLFDAAQTFLRKIEKDGTLDRLTAFYGQGKTFDGIGVRVFQRDMAQRLPRYQKLFEQNAQTHDMDWRLLAAIAYQESKWQPNAVSPTGVRGIMMLTNDTASYMKVADRTNPTQSIRGGSAYYKEQMDRLPAEIREPDRTWMALAAYNMGPGYIDRARKLAREAGDDASKWLYVSRHLREMALNARRQGKPVPPAGQALHYVQEVRRYYDTLLLASQYSERSERVAMYNAQ